MMSLNLLKVSIGVVEWRGESKTMKLKIKCQCGEELLDIGLNFLGTSIQKHYYRNISKMNKVDDYFVFKSSSCPYCLTED